MIKEGRDRGGQPPLTCADCPPLATKMLKPHTLPVPLQNLSLDSSQYSRAIWTLPHKNAGNRQSCAESKK